MNLVKCQTCMSHSLVHHFQIAGHEDRIQCLSEKFVVVVAWHDEQVVFPPTVSEGVPFVPQSPVKVSSVESVKVLRCKLGEAG